MGYNLFSGPNGRWRVLRAPTAQEARAMSLLLLAEGARWQRVFAWPPNHFQVAEELGKLNSSLLNLNPLLNGTHIELSTSHKALMAHLFYNETEAFLLIVNRDSLPTIGSVSLKLPWVQEAVNVTFGYRIEPMITAQNGIDSDISAYYMNPRIGTTPSLTISLKAWDAHIYQIIR